MNLLKTDTADYLFDINNPDLILKKSGKFSTVYLGYQLPDKQPVVIKIINKEIAEQPNGLKRFIKEASFTLSHSSLQKTLACYTDGENHFLIKQYIQGQTLRQLLDSKASYSKAFYCKCIIEVLGVLEFLHTNGIYHCDIRPDNILVASQNDSINVMQPKIYLLDLGLAKTNDNKDSTDQSPFALIYSPPEQLLNYYQLVNASADIFSTGITLYECLTGYKPFITDHPEFIMHLQLNAAIEKRNLPNDLFKILLQATAKYKFTLPPSQLEEDEIIANLKNGMLKRFQNATEMKVALEECLRTNNLDGFSLWNWVNQLLRKL